MSWEDATHTVSRWALARVLIRGLLLQAAFNHERMQNLGFAYAMAPALEQLYRDPEARAEATRRHLELYNTHPYLASLVLGVVVRLEEQISAGEASKIEECRSFKVGTMGGMGALGDAFFWASWKPLVLSLAVLISLYSDSLILVLASVLLYNLVHLSARIVGFGIGYRLGRDALMQLQKLNLPRLGKWVKRSTLALLGLTAALAAQEIRLPGYDHLEAPYTLGLLVVTFGAWRCIVAGLSMTWLLYILTGLSILLSWLIR